ncbi:MAG: hypothetical protein PHQ28_15735 [Mycobacterium sp.]|nr:hypothetical protein [Mycobacterium sp.]
MRTAVAHDRRLADRAAARQESDAVPGELRERGARVGPLSERLDPLANSIASVGRRGAGVGLDIGGGARSDNVP